MGVPPIFLGVAAFLLYIVIGRMVQSEHTQTALLKAFGYRNPEVGAHYFKLIMAIALGGALGGVSVRHSGTGGRLGLHRLFQVSFPVFQLDPAPSITGVTVNVAAAAAGGILGAAAGLCPCARQRYAPPRAVRTSAGRAALAAGWGSCWTSPAAWSCAA